MSKKTSIIDILGELKPQLFFITETMLKESAKLNIDGYTFCGRSRDKRSCGGVGILVSNEIRSAVDTNLLRPFRLAHHQTGEYITRIEQAKSYLEKLMISDFYENEKFTGWTKD